MSDAGKKLGVKGEQLAAAYLKQKGYTILEQNFRCRAGELDIIAKDDNYLVIVEVKTRRSTQFGLPAEAVDFRKQRQICRATRHYLHQNATEGQDIRFDVIAIIVGKSEPLIDHISNAFDYWEPE